MHREARIAPVCPKGTGKGQQPHPLPAMPRLHCVQLFCNPAIEDLLCEAESARRFSGVRLEKNMQRSAPLPGFSNLMIVRPRLP